MKKLIFLLLFIPTLLAGQIVLLGDEQYGSELVINGDFAVSTGWTFNDDWSYDAVNLEADYTDGVQSYFDRSITITAGITYQVSYTIKNYSAGTGYIWFTNQTGSGLFSVSWWTITANGVFTANYVALESATSLKVYAHSLSVNYSVDDISIKAVTKEAGFVLTNNGVVLTFTPSGFSAEYQAVYDAYTIKPDAATAAIWNTYVESGVADGWWAKEDVEYVYAAHTNDNGEALINWINPGTFDATAFNAPAFTANEGFLGNGTTQYTNTGGWIPSVNGVNYLQDDASQIIYIRTNISHASWHGTGENADTKDCMISPKNGASGYIRTNDGTSVGGVNADGLGMYVNTRTASNVKKLYKNKVAIINASTISIGAPTHSPYCLAYNDDDSAAGFRTDQVSMYAFGGGFTQTDVNNKTDAFETAMDALGTGVIAMTELDILMKLQYMAFQLRIQNEKVPVYINP